ncbi:hypothetical protein [Nocardia amamiensis]|uniref:hypothetical protein n=1 Tax=Nocardia amamiensis TaxID=404578 RepID=UPI00082F757E|nr:hypothetical protein [Nocardia amamiensis]
MASEDLEARVAALSGQIHELDGRVRNIEQDAAAVRVLAGGVARKVSVIRSEMHELRQAMMSGIAVMRQDLADLRTQVNDQFTEMPCGFAEIRGKLDTAAAGQAQIAALVTTLIERTGSR